MILLKNMVGNESINKKRANLGKFKYISYVFNRKITP